MKKILVIGSSDGIFDGAKGDYSEKEEPRPITFYGKNLLVCEKLVRSNIKDYCIVRPAYIYGYAKGRLDGRLYHASNSLR